LAQKTIFYLHGGTIKELEVTFLRQWIVSLLMSLLPIALMMNTLYLPIVAIGQSDAMVALHQGRVAGYYGSVYAVTPDRIQFDNQTLKQLGVNYSVSTQSQPVRTPVVEVDVVERNEKLPKAKSRRGITMAEYVANQVRSSQSNRSEAILVASLDDQ